MTNKTQAPTPENPRKAKYKTIDDRPNLGPPEIMPDGFKVVKFLEGQRNPAPKILWGKHFDPETPKMCPKCDGAKQVEVGQTGKTEMADCSKCEGTGTNPDWRPIEWQLDRVMKVASAMNHAADHAQQELRAMIDIANHQERQIEAHKKAFEEQRQVMINMTTEHNRDQQARMQEMQDIKAENKRIMDALLLLASDIASASPAFIQKVLSGAWRATMEDRKSIAVQRREFAK